MTICFTLSCLIGFYQIRASMLAFGFLSLRFVVKGSFN